MVADIAVESEVGEFDDDRLPLLRHETESLGDQTVTLTSQGWVIVSARYEPRAFSLLYLQVSQFRI